MALRIPFLSRREFLANTTAASATGIFGSSVLRARSQGTVASATGKKGQVYPDQRRKYQDSKSGNTVWQLTSITPDRSVGLFNIRNRRTTPDSRWLIYLSDRGGPQRRRNLFKMDLRTGESIQITETGDITGSPEVSHSGKDVYFFGADNAFRVVNIETLQEREITRLRFDNPIRFNAPLSISPKDEFVVCATHLEERPTTREWGRIISTKRHYGHFTPWGVKCKLMTIRTDNGLERTLFTALTSLEHAGWNPTDPNLINYSNWGPSYFVQRNWLIRPDGTGNRPIFVTSNGEGSCHEIWSESGKTLYVNCHGGRVPQGLWAVNIDGSNERSVLAGSTVSHNTVNPEEDRFVVDELYGEGDGLWMSRKGSNEPKLLCQKASWFEVKPNGSINSAGHHTDQRFLPNGQGVTFNNGGELYLVEV